MPHPYINHEICHTLAGVPRVELEFREVNRTLADFLCRYADIPYYLEDDVGLGRRFPYLGDCLRELDWAHEEIFVVYTGRHNLVVASGEQWPEYPCRRLTQDEFYDVMRPLTVAYRISHQLELGTERKQEQINVQFRRLFGYVQRLRIA